MSDNSEQSSADEYRVPDEHFQEYLAHDDELLFSPDTVTSYDSHLTLYVQFLHDRGWSFSTPSWRTCCLHRALCPPGEPEEHSRGEALHNQRSVSILRLRTDAGDDLTLDPLRPEDIDLSRYQYPEPIAQEALSPEEVRRLFGAFESYRNRLIAVVGAETGLRNSDLRTLRVRDVDSNDLNIYLADPKNSHSYVVPISPELAFEVDLWLRHHRGGYANGVKSEYLFREPHRRS